jgi:RNA polymerase sigma-70 factor (ECF subfamily)
MNAADRVIEELLVLRCQAGDQAAFEALVRKYHSPLLYYARRMVGDEAEDVVQQMWMAVHTGLPRLRHTDGFRVWVYRIARNMAGQVLRRRWPVADETELEDVADTHEAEPSFAVEDAAMVHAGLEKLAPAHREVLVLRFIEEMSYEEISQITGCEVGTVKSRIHYAKRALRRQLEQVP